MKKLIFAFSLGLLLVACRPTVQQNKPVANNPALQSFKNEFIEKLWTTYPTWATALGYHKYDSVLIVPDKAARDNELNFAAWVEDGLQKINVDSLNANDRTDYHMLQNFARGVRFNINEFKSYAWDPSSYNIGEALFDILDYKKETLDERLRAISIKLIKVPAYFEAAKANIKDPTFEHTKLAIAQNQGSLYFFNKTFPDSLKISGLNKEEKAAFNDHAAAARKAIEDYVKYLQQDIVAKSDTTKMRSFRIGKELYAKKFLLDINARYTSDAMYKKAEERKAWLHNDMNQLANSLWSKYFGAKEMPKDTLEKIRALIDKISEQHCQRDSFLQTIEKQLPELTAFINAHHIIDLDSTKPLKVRKTPDYLAGVAGAGINSPGPYDKDAVTYYNVTPLTKYSDAEAESYLREYNDYVLQILNIHEAIPGHYTQLIYANRTPDIIKSIFGNGAMIEGWACYVERMMLEEGYHKSPEMQLFYDKWNLREVCNFILDYNMQCNNWSEKQVMDLIVKQAFQEEAEAHEKWKRATLSQVQLASYFSGQTEIYELREEMKKKLGAQFDLKKFHEQFLSYGSAPVKEIRDLMLGE
jgi:uncharacterized protein (DUF885 family)